MKIQSSSIAMSAKAVSTKSYSVSESLRYWKGGENSGTKANNKSHTGLPGMKGYRLEISEESRKRLQQQILRLRHADSENNIGRFSLSDVDKRKIHLLEKFIEAITGKKIKINIPDDIVLHENSTSVEMPSAQPVSTGAPVQSSAGIPHYGWGLAYNYSESYVEQEKMSFNSSGIIKTSDGKEINFEMELNMSREFISQNTMNIRAGDALCDPLVINFDAPAAEISDTKFSFDLDCNGTQDQISFVSQGSGFLALDKNNDGKINDGSELFGPRSGDGFADLSGYDSDQNGWIDENDPIFDKLRIWTKYADGNDRLFALGEKGVGAIYLGNVSTPFSIKNTDNELEGQISKTGIFVRENGTVGTLQHVDLAI